MKITKAHTFQVCLFNVNVNFLWSFISHLHICLLHEIKYIISDNINQAFIGAHW